MPIRFAPTCAAYYVNLRVNLKMDLPTKRETVLGLFDRLRRQRPGLSQFRRYQNELALESDAAEADSPTAGAWQEWVAVRRTSVRAGSVCPREWDDAYALHTAVIESAPYYLDISALDIESIEVLLGFDLAASGNHDAIICDALMAGTPMAQLATGISEPGRKGGSARPMTFRPVDCQPIFGVALNDANDLQAHIEVKTRSSRRGASVAASTAEDSPSRGREEPLSLYLIIRRFGPFSDVAALPALLGDLRSAAHDLLDAYVEPKVLTPIREEIVAGGGGGWR